MAQENADSILVLGKVKPLEYFMNNEEIKNINYLEIRQRDGFYEIEVNYGVDSDYIIFQIENIKRIGYLDTGKLSNIHFEGDGTAYIDHKATGTIEINESNRSVKVEIRMRISRSEMNLVLSWENKDIK
jgi:hypothetical protein